MLVRRRYLALTIRPIKSQLSCDAIMLNNLKFEYIHVYNRYKFVTMYQYDVQLYKHDTVAKDQLQIVFAYNGR